MTEAIRSLECSRIQQDGSLCKKGNLDTETVREGRGCEETQGEDVKERDLEQIFLSQPSEGAKPFDTLI